MFCTECGAKVNEDNKFCDNCGHQLIKDEANVEAEKEKVKSSRRRYWDKFTEIYTSGDSDWKNKMISDSAWELLNRFSGNLFVSFMEEHPILNKHSHKEIDSIKTEFNTASGAGYYFWLAEQLFNGRDLQPPKPPDTDGLSKEWEKEKVFEDTKTFFANLPDDVSSSMNDFHAWRAKSLLETSPALNDLPNELIEEINNKLAILMLMGYSSGMVEDKYRK
ncbi:MAG TPA: zinc ribbon domain-containing protein [Candidatus Nanoarchaeia archaeon]